MRRPLDETRKFQHSLNSEISESGGTGLQDSVILFERAASRAAALAATVTDDQLDLATPCTEWTVADLVEHMVGGTGYLLGALGVDSAPTTAARSEYGARVEWCVAELRLPGVLE